MNYSGIEFTQYDASLHYQKSNRDNVNGDYWIDNIVKVLSDEFQMTDREYKGFTIAVNQSVNDNIID